MPTMAFSLRIFIEAFDGAIPMKLEGGASAPR
jgi:hypothetical protein